MNYLAKLVDKDRPEQLHAWLALVIGLALVGMFLLLGVGSFLGKGLSVEYTATVTAVSGLVAYVFKKGKDAEKQGSITPDIDKG